MNVPEGIYCCFKGVWAGMVVVGQEKVHDWSEIRLRVCGEPIEAFN